MSNKTRIRAKMEMSPAKTPPRQSSRKLLKSSTSIALPPGLKLHTRNLLTAYVNHNQATKLWITTINTNQKASLSGGPTTRHLKAFSFRTEHEARESAYVNAPPELVPFEAMPNCFHCDKKFNSVLRRPSHCRNCGVCICNTCSTSWSKLMVPETYNTKHMKTVKICRTCDYLSTAFRHALLNGNYDNAIKIYMTGNINLRCPFVNVKNFNGNEIIFPIHGAISGGNLKLLSWLVDVHYCPLIMTNTGNRHTQATTELIKTSKGRTVIDIAIEEQHVDILQYLVNQKRLKVSEEKGKNAQALLALEAVLKAMPKSPKCIEQTNWKSPSQRSKTESNKKPEKLSKPPSFRHKKKYNQEAVVLNSSLFKISRPDDDDDYYSDSDESERYDSFDSQLGESKFAQDEGKTNDDDSVSTTLKDPCVICYENTIDCVLTPCGHQICCLQCSQNMSKCPICSTQCQSIRIFRP